MLTEERYKLILDYLAKSGTASVRDLSLEIGTSESTIRRDLSALAQEGLLRKVYGGAAAIEHKLLTEEKDVLSKQNLNYREKQAIGKFAASLIQKGDFVFIDAGTTTEAMISALTEKQAIYATNGLFQAQLLCARGFETVIIGGPVRSLTEAIAGPMSIEQLEKYNFSVGFFGVNGISRQAGYTTPDLIEGGIKAAAFRQCMKAYILADSSKFDLVYPRSFARIEQAQIITNHVEDEQFKKYTTIWETDHDLHTHF